MQVNPLEQGEGKVYQRGDKQTIDADSCFENGVSGKRIKGSVNDLSAEEAAQSQPPHERCQNSRYGVMGIAHYQGEQACPHHLIDEAGST